MKETELSALSFALKTFSSKHLETPASQATIGLRVSPPAQDNMFRRFPIVTDLREDPFTTNRAHMTAPTF
jgi:hypothetical protein